MDKDTNRKMEYRLELMVLLVFLTTASSFAPSSSDLAEAVVSKCKTNSRWKDIIY